MSFYVEVTIIVYNDGPVTWAVGPFMTHEKADETAKSLERRLTGPKYRKLLDEKYGSPGEYNVTCIALAFRTPTEVLAEATE